MQWDGPRKEQLLEKWKSLGWRYCLLKLYIGPNCPPLGTVKAWKESWLHHMPLRQPGRPTRLSPMEESLLSQFVGASRADGVVLDNECLCLLAQTVVELTLSGVF